MYSLILDTSDKFLGVMLLRDQEVLDHVYFMAFRQQSELLVPTIAEVLGKNNITLKEITGIYINNGPGSYTGIRMSLAFAKTMSFINRAKVYLCSSLLAQVGLEKEKVISVLDARAQRVYCGIYQNGQLLEPERVIGIADFKTLVAQNPAVRVLGNLEIAGLKIEKPCNPLFAIHSLIKQLKASLDPLRITPFYFQEAVVHA